MFPLHRCEPMSQLEIVIARVLRNLRGQAQQHQPSAEDTARAALRRAAEMIARACGLNLSPDDILNYPEEFMRAWRAARSSTHPDREHGNEELFKLVNQAADALKSAFRQKGIQI